MGTWGVNAFEDDTAMEYYDEFCEGGQTLADLEQYIDLVLERQYNMSDLLMEGFTEPVKALVSAEIIASAVGNPSDKFPDDEYHSDFEIPAIDLKKMRAGITDETKEKTRRMLEKIKTTKDIHSTELWMESESYSEWTNYIDDLIGRLK